MEAGVQSKLPEKEAELIESFGSVYEKLTQLIEKVEKLKVGQVSSIASNYGKSICEYMLQLIEANIAFESAAERDAWGEKVKADCEQWSLHASCLPKDDTSRDSILLMAEFAQSLCLTGRNLYGLWAMCIRYYIIELLY